MENFKEEFENLKNENARLTELVKVLEEQIKSLNLRLRLERELAVYEYFLPLANVEPKKEKVFRPCTLQEFKGNLPKMIFPDDLIHFRHKNNEFSEYAQRYNGYIVNSRATAICLGSREYTLGDLFKNFEYLDKDGGWNTFGVEE